jgi:hypothetical protein
VSSGLVIKMTKSKIFVKCVNYLIQEKNMNYPDNYDDNEEFTETLEGEEARYKRARQYDDLNGAPEGEDDR